MRSYIPAFAVAALCLSASAYAKTPNANTAVAATRVFSGGRPVSASAQLYPLDGVGTSGTVRCVSTTCTDSFGVVQIETGTDLREPTPESEGYRTYDASKRQLLSIEFASPHPGKQQCASSLIRLLLQKGDVVPNPHAASAADLFVVTPEPLQERTSYVFAYSCSFGRIAGGK